MGSLAPRCPLTALRSPLAALRSPLSAFLGIILLATIGVVAQAPAPGATLDPSTFRYARAIAPGPEALVVLPLDLAVLAHSRGPEANFADVRITDTANRQIQYLLEQTGSIELDSPFQAVPDPPRELASSPGHTRTTYAITLPYSQLPGISLMVFTSETKPFRRLVQAGVERRADRRHRDGWVDVLATGEWTCCNDVPLALTPGASRIEATTVMLTIDEGDNAPLPITAVWLVLPNWSVRFYRPADEPLRLLYGNEAVRAPVYDLALMRARVMQTHAVKVSPDPEVTAKSRTAAILSPRVFWGFLIAAVVVLFGLIARLAILRSSEDPPPPSAPRP